MAQPIQAAQPYYPQIDKSVPPEITVHLQRIYPAINDHDAAIVNLKSQLTSATTAATTTSTNTVTTITNSVTAFPGIGNVNNQTGVSSYTIQNSDNGILLVVDDASPIAVTLSSLVTAPYLIFITNLGAGTVTLTPSTGTINGGSSFILLQNYTSIVVFDKTNWWASDLPVVPVNTSAVTHKFFTDYNASTGIFSMAQPAFTDISGTAAAAQLPTPTASTLGGVESIGPVTSEWIYEIDTAGVPHLSQPTSADVVPASGATGSRPTSHATGQPYFDTSLGIPIWWSGSNWVNASGMVV